MAFTFRAMPTAIGETVEDDLTTLIVAWAMPGLEIFEPASLRPKMRASVWAEPSTKNKDT